MKQYKLLGLLTTLNITFMLISQVTAGKIIQLFIFPVSATVLYFPVVYIISDVMTEVYGYARARRVLWLTLLCSAIAVIVYQVVVHIPPAKGFQANDAYVAVFGIVPRVFIGSWIAVFVGDIVNNYILAKMKVWTQGKHLWARTIGSTVFGEGVNTSIFYVIVLSGVLPSDVLIVAILSGWFLKTIVEILFTPLTYYAVRKVKEVEHEDYYDTSTDFNPFSLRVQE